MDALKRNAFWVGVGSFVGIVVIIGVIVVGGQKGQASQLSSTITGSDGRLQDFMTRDQEGKLEADSWGPEAVKYVQALEKSRDDIKAYYTSEGGKILNTWFPKFKSGAPSLDEFKTTYTDETDKLKIALEEKGVRVGPVKAKPGAGPTFGTRSADETGFEKIEEATPANMSGLMKHYWIQKRLADVLLESGVLVLSGVRFLDQIGTSGGTSASGTPGVPPGGVVTGAARVASSNPKLPLDLGEVIEFEVTLEIYYPDVPNLLANFLKIDKTVPLFTRVKKLDIKKTQVPPEKREIKITPQEADDPNRVKPEPDRIPVKVVLTGEVLDFVSPAR